MSQATAPAPDANQDEKRSRSLEEQARMRQRRGIELGLAKLRNDLLQSTNARYTQQIEAAIRDLEAQLAQLGE